MTGGENMSLKETSRQEGLQIKMSCGGWGGVCFGLVFYPCPVLKRQEDVLPEGPEQGEKLSSVAAFKVSGLPIKNFK